MKLNELKPNIRSNKIRRGRGDSSTKGSFCGRGCKGQNARSGGGVRIGFEGGQSPLIARMPKLPNLKPKKTKPFVIHAAIIEANFNDGDSISIYTLLEKKLINKKIKTVKILEGSTLNKKLDIDKNILVTKNISDKK